MLDKQILTQGLQKRPLISFIVTTYNLQPELLAECLDSIMALSLSDQEREVILVDDGSDIPAIMQLTDYQNNIIYIDSLTADCRKLEMQACELLQANISSL